MAKRLRESHPNRNLPWPDDYWETSNDEPYGEEWLATQASASMVGASFVVAVRAQALIALAAGDRERHDPDIVPLLSDPVNFAILLCVLVAGHRPL